MFLPEKVSFIINRLESLGFSAGAVGGAVRDTLLGREVGDYDITTSARPENIVFAFPELRVIETGIKHGTVTLLVDGETFEVTTYRIDGDYKDNRHPDSVEFTSELSLDLSRRDFTVNAMYYNDTEGLVDLFGGREDIERGLIRAVGEAEKRFEEDGLRILRAIRFASVLFFSLEEKTREAVHRKAYLLNGISRERIYTEFKKLISGVGAYRVLCEYSDVIRVIIPELSGLSLPPEESFNEASFEARLLSLFALNSNNPREDFSHAMQSLKTDKAIRVRGVEALNNYNEDYKKDSDLGMLLMRAGEEAALLTLELRRALGLDAGDEVERLVEILSGGLPYKISHLQITGNDILTLGYSGKDVGRVLHLALIAVINGEIKNERKVLLRFSQGL